MVNSVLAALGVARASQPVADAPGTLRRRLDIQGLRAVAVLMVVAFHAGLPVPGGFIGVDVFFVISGFVITAMLMREWDSTGRIRLGRFYLRRFKRLTPALFLTLGVVMVASSLLLSPIGSQQTAAKTAVGAMFLAANLVIARTTGDYFDARAETNPLLNTWSLSVEEQFYLVFPAVLLGGLLLGARGRRNRITPVVVVGFVGALSFLLALVGSGSFGLYTFQLPVSLVGFYSPVTRAWEFAAGSLLALGGARLTVSSPRLAGIVLLTGSGLLTASLWVIRRTTPFPGIWTLLPVIGTLLVLVAGPHYSAIARVLASRPMVLIGDLSYSIYLWHWPFIVFGSLLWPGSDSVLLIAAALSVIPAYASFRWVEEPIRSLPVAGGGSIVRLVAATVTLPFLLAVGLVIAANAGFWNTSVRGYQEAIQASHAGISTGCTAEAWTKSAECTWNGNALGRPVYLVGDSNADQFIEALMGATEQPVTRPLVSLTENACAFLPTSLAMEDPVLEDRCSRYAANTKDYLIAAKPGLVVVANSYPWWLESHYLVGKHDEAQGRELQGELDALFVGLSDSVRALQDAGHEVLLVQTVPQWGDQHELSWAGCAVLDMLGDGCSRTMSMVDVIRRQGAAADVVAAVALATGAGVLDLSSELCPDGTCSSVTRDGLFRYRDGTHITVSQSVALTATFKEAIANGG